jgi:SSS family solute:Na+ symporter
MAALISFFGIHAAVALLTWWRSRRRDGGDFFLGRRTLGAPVVAMSLLLTNLSTEQLVGLNGDGYRHGAVAIAWEIFGAFGLVLFALVFLPRYWAAGVTTIPEFIEQRCGAPTRRLMTVLMLLSLVGIGLPFVIYSGALALVGIFDLPGRFGLTHDAALLGCSLALGVVGGGYALLGGMRGTAVADVAYGIVFAVGAVLIPVLGLLALGNGDWIAGCARLLAARPEAFNPFGHAGSPVPAGTLLTGIIVINISAWCANQKHAQRAFAGSSLAEAQRGVLLAASVKLFAPLVLVLPGMIAWVYFSGGLPSGDLAYPRLVQALLPASLAGFFGAVIASAVVTASSGAIHSATTLFVVDVLGRPPETGAADAGRLPRRGLWFGLAAVALAVALTPVISRQDLGFFVLMKRLNATFTIPVVAVVVASVLTGWRWSRWTVPVAMAIGSLVYLALGQWTQIHWLHSVALAATVVVAVLWFRRQSNARYPWHPTALTAELNSRRLFAAAIIVAGFGIYAGLAALARWS